MSELLLPTVKLIDGTVYRAPTVRVQATGWVLLQSTTRDRIEWHPARSSTWHPVEHRSILEFPAHRVMDVRI